MEYKTYEVRVYPNGTKEWWLNGELHREDGPAIECFDGIKEWWLNGKLHREDGPAYEGADGTKEWWLNGKLHREDGPVIEGAGGTKYWYLNGKRHREDGPAYEGADGTKSWYFNGKLHRENGPAIEGAGGTKYWYLNGEELTEAEFNAKKNFCEGKEVEIDGKRYKLTLITDILVKKSNESKEESVKKMKGKRKSHREETHRQRKCVHTEHCCINCGCKYGEDDTCPVVLGLKEQSYPCGKACVCDGW